MLMNVIARTDGLFGTRFAIIRRGGYCHDCFWPVGKWGRGEREFFVLARVERRWDNHSARRGRL